MRPIIPDIEVKGILRRRPFIEVNRAAPVVIKLDHDEIECHSAGQSRAIGCIRIHTLRCCSEVERLACSRVYETAKLLSKGHDVVNARLEVKVEAIYNSRAKWTVDVASGVDGTEHVPYHLRCILGGT